MLFLIDWVQPHDPLGAGPTWVGLSRSAGTPCPAFDPGRPPVESSNSETYLSGLPSEYIHLTSRLALWKRLGLSVLPHDPCVRL